ESDCRVEAGKVRKRRYGSLPSAEEGPEEEERRGCSCNQRQARIARRRGPVVTVNLRLPRPFGIVGIGDEGVSFGDDDVGLAAGLEIGVRRVEGWRSCRRPVRPRATTSGEKPHPSSPARLAALRLSRRSGCFCRSGVPCLATFAANDGRL